MSTRSSLFFLMTSNKMFSRPARLQIDSFSCYLLLTCHQVKLSLCKWRHKLTEPIFTSRFAKSSFIVAPWPLEVFSPINPPLNHLLEENQFRSEKKIHCFNLLVNQNVSSPSIPHHQCSCHSRHPGVWWVPLDRWYTPRWVLCSCGGECHHSRWAENTANLSELRWQEPEERMLPASVRKEVMLSTALWTNNNKIFRNHMCVLVCIPPNRSICIFNKFLL